MAAAVRQVSERTDGSSDITPVRVAAAERNINSQIFPEQATRSTIDEFDLTTAHIDNGSSDVVAGAIDLPH
jgi:hypothetical protein